MATVRCEECDLNMCMASIISQLWSTVLLRVHCSVHRSSVENSCSPSPVYVPRTLGGSPQTLQCVYLHNVSAQAHEKERHKVVHGYPRVIADDEAADFLERCFIREGLNVKAKRATATELLEMDFVKAELQKKGGCRCGCDDHPPDPSKPHASMFN